MSESTNISFKEKLNRIKADQAARRKQEEEEQAKLAEQKAQEAAPEEQDAVDPAALKVAANDHSVFLGGVDYAVTEIDLRRNFDACGEIKRCTIVHYPNGRPKGYAYIEFSDMQGVENALKLNGCLTLKGREIVVKPKRENKPGLKRSPRRKFMRRQ